MARMNLKYAPFFFLIGLATTNQRQCGNNKNYLVTTETGTVRAPEREDVSESCSWEFSLPSRSKLLLLNFTDIKLYYVGWGTNNEGDREYAGWCSQKLTVGKKDVECDWITEPFCNVYYRDDRCLNHLFAPEMSECDVGKAASVNVEFSSSGESGYESGHLNYAQGFKMEYRYIDCLGETTTAAITTSPRSTAPQSSTTHKIIPQLSTISSTTVSVDPHSLKAITASAPTDSAYTTGENSTILDKEGLAGGGNMTVIAVVLTCILLVLLLLALLIFTLVRRRNQDKTPGEPEESEYQEIGAGESAGAAVYSVANDNIAVGTTHQAANETDQNTYASIAAPNQSGIATYSTLNLDHVASQSTSRAQHIDQSTYSTLDHDGQFSQSNPTNATTGQSETTVYSAVNREPGTTKVTVHYNVQNNRAGNQQTGEEMVENVLYESR